MLNIKPQQKRVSLASYNLETKTNSILLLAGFECSYVVNVSHMGWWPSKDCVVL